MWDSDFRITESSENSDKLVRLTQSAYITALDNLHKKQHELNTEIQEAEKIIQEYSAQMAKDDSKHILEYLAEGIEELTAQIRELKYAFKNISEEILRFPDFKPALIRRNAKHYAALLEKKEFKTSQQTFNSMIRVIHIDNETVETTLKLNTLLDSYQPIYATIIEDRDNIARPENHFKRALVFSTLTVRL